MAYQATTPPRGPIFDAVALAAQGDHLRQTVHVVRRKADGAIGVSYVAAMPSDTSERAAKKCMSGPPGVRQATSRW